MSMDGASALSAASATGALAHDSAHRHVAGDARYVDDHAEPGAMVHLAFGLSAVARGRILSLDLAPVRAAPGVIRVLTADDLPGINDTGPVARDEPALAFSERRGGEVNYHGQALFLVVARTREAARLAAKLAVVEYEEEAPILSIDDAIAAGSYLTAPYRMAAGDAVDAIAAAPRRLKGRIEMGGQEHFYLEGQVAVATPGEGDEMHVLSSTQHPSEVQAAVAHNLALPANAVTVEVRRMGGGFGGKETQGALIAVAAALAAKLTGRPAKLRLDRDDDMILTGKRHPFRVDYEVGFDDEGCILGVRFEQWANCGWSEDLSAAIADRAMFHADNAYFYPAAEIISHRCRTNLCSMTAFRGFGGPQGVLGAERMIQHIAHELGRDPLTIRRRNFYASAGAGEARAMTPYGMRVEDCVIGEIVDDLVVAADYHARRAEIAEWNSQSPVMKRGISLTPVKFGISFTTTHLNQAGALVLIYQDGSVMLNHGGTEMGQGLYRKVAQVAAAEFGLPDDAIRITATRTDKVPNTSPTAASSGSDMNGMAVKDACDQLKARIAAHLGAEGAIFENGMIRWTGGETSWAEAVSSAYMARVSLAASGFYATPKLTWDRPAAKGRPFYYFAYGAAVTEVLLDTLTGENRMLRVDILHDVGRSLNPAIDLGQVEGGFIQGVGWLTTEELVWDPKGRLATHAPSTYKIPTAGDRPEVMNMRLWAKGENRELTIRRSKAVGEPPLMLGVSAFLALQEAMMASAGEWRPLDAPATAERLLMALD
ncbi:xanthine dehydrogenase molybdopterin binding subunit [Pikeienuella piscinae]|nr:xanthine dehydrogenase molybdopterin binding subunit [Pikeienuella piscinae]